mmetsp:Transcript_429/g.753  ORF Transcript_429/g.753 Transcript_429/m.753 type:complete len:265 (+) Transcript_429:4301-5095(+)
MPMESPGEYAMPDPAMDMSSWMTLREVPHGSLPAYSPMVASALLSVSHLASSTFASYGVSTVQPPSGQPSPKPFDSSTAVLLLLLVVLLLLLLLLIEVFAMIASSSFSTNTYGQLAAEQVLARGSFVLLGAPTTASGATMFLCSISCRKERMPAGNSVNPIETSGSIAEVALHKLLVLLPVLQTFPSSNSSLLFSLAPTSTSTSDISICFSPPLLSISAVSAISTDFFHFSTVSSIPVPSSAQCKSSIRLPPNSPNRLSIDLPI